MPKFSRFTPCGMLTLSSKPSHAETIYKALVRSQAEAYTGTTAGRQEAKLYAQAMGLARAQYALEHAGNQQDPYKAGDLFPNTELEHGLVPRPTDTMAERRGALAARMLLPAGASQTNIENALRALLGNDFISYRPTPDADAVNYPTTCGDQPMNLQLPSVPRKRITITPAISTGLGAPKTVAYTDLKPSADVFAPYVSTLLIGDVLVVEPGNDSFAERVTVTAVGVEPISESEFVPTFEATFSKPHSAGALGVTQPFPYWISTKRHSLVVLTAAAAADPEKRRRVHDLMGRIARGVSTWDIAGLSGSGVAGPFTVGEGLLGITPLGTIAL